MQSTGALVKYSNYYFDCIINGNREEERVIEVYKYIYIYVFFKVQIFFCKDRSIFI